LVSEHFPWQGIVGKFFLFFADFFFGEEKEGRDIPEIYVYLCAKFAEIGCISEFLSEKHPIKKKKKNRLKRSPGSKVIEVLKSVIFRVFSADDRVIFLIL
jgi:hypothetical protein